jgi:hypothetical protein
VTSEELKRSIELVSLCGVPDGRKLPDLQNGSVVVPRGLKAHGEDRRRDLGRAREVA